MQKVKDSLSYGYFVMVNQIEMTTVEFLWRWLHSVLNTIYLLGIQQLQAISLTTITIMKWLF